MIKVIVTDDSAFMRKILSDIISSDPELEVVATAKDGLDLLEKLSEYNPDVITLDISMPNLDGVSTLKRIMKEHPLPVIMISSLADEEYTFTCLELGAVDFIPKTSGIISIDMSKKKDIVINKIKAAASAKIGITKSGIKSNILTAANGKYKEGHIVVIGASTGGPRVIESILSEIPEEFSVPIIIIQHMPVEFTSVFAKRLDSVSKLKVKEAQNGDLIKGGTVYIAPGNLNIILAKKDSDVICKLEHSDCCDFTPCIDATMISAAQVFEEKTIGVVLSGMGHDGTKGLFEIKNKKGKAFVQDEDSCTVPAMPRSAIQAGCIDKIVKIENISQEIVHLLET